MKKSKLQILAETLEEAEMEGVMAAALQMNDDDEATSLKDEKAAIRDDSTERTPLLQQQQQTPFGCGICSRTFKQAVMLRKHMKVHATTAALSKLEPKHQQQQQQQIHTCDECCKTFATRAVLQAHLRSHSSLKPFKCSNCLKEFKSKHSLNEHVLLKHKGEKVFGCSLCGEQFSSKHMRSVHERLHKVRIVTPFGEGVGVCFNSPRYAGTVLPLPVRYKEHRIPYPYRELPKGIKRRSLTRFSASAFFMNRTLLVP